ncbi:hypothetical protein KEM56_006066 [Ascosphaera pollenicola]|nr:hypothetical protein KEM56_006066 [Ascosphaera pollenicola]
MGLASKLAAAKANAAGQGGPPPGWVPGGPPPGPPPGQQFVSETLPLKSSRAAQCHHIDINC